MWHIISVHIHTLVNLMQIVNHRRFWIGIGPLKRVRVFNLTFVRCILVLHFAVCCEQRKYVLWTTHNYLKKLVIKTFCTILIFNKKNPMEISIYFLHILMSREREREKSIFVLATMFWKINRVFCIYEYILFVLFLALFPIQSIFASSSSKYKRRLRSLFFPEYIFM